MNKELKKYIDKKVKETHEEWIKEEERKRVEKIKDECERKIKRLNFINLVLERENACKKECKTKEEYEENERYKEKLKNEILDLIRDESNGLKNKNE